MYHRKWQLEPSPRILELSFENFPFISRLHHLKIPVISLFSNEDGPETISQRGETEVKRAKESEEKKTIQASKKSPDLISKYDSLFESIMISENLIKL